MNIKMFDEVRVSYCSTEYGGRYVGAKGKVVHIPNSKTNDSIGVRLDLYTNPNGNSGRFYFSSSHLEKIEVMDKAIDQTTITPAGITLNYPTIKNVYFNKPYVIVIWSDKTKTIVKNSENDIYDPEKGLAMAVSKRFLGTNKNRSNYYDIFDKWLPNGEDTEPETDRARNGEAFEIPVGDPNGYMAPPKTNLSCKTCKFRDSSIYEMPCSTCIPATHSCYEAADPECRDCKYGKSYAYEEPCMSCIGCGGYPNFELKYT